MEFHFNVIFKGGQIKMAFNYLLIILILGLFLLYSLWSSSSEAKVKNLPRRDKRLAEMTAKGYKISKRWDCNALTFFIDEKKKVLCFLVMAWRKDTVYDIPIESIKEITIGDVGITKKSNIKSLITQVFLNIDTDKGTYVLRTLYVKGIGVKSTSPHVEYARKCAEEIRDYVERLKK